MSKKIRVFAVVLAAVMLVGAMGACKPGDDVSSGGTSSGSTSSNVDDTDDTSSDNANSGALSGEPDEMVSDPLDPSTQIPSHTVDPQTPEEAVDYIEEFTGTTYYSNLKTADTLYRINGDFLTHAERVMMLSLSGIVAQTECQIFISYSAYSDANVATTVWEQALQDYYGIKFIDIDDPWEMVEHFRSYIKDDGYVGYETYVTGKDYGLDLNAPSSINVATVISGVENYLMVEDTLVAKAESIGLVKKDDGRNYDEYEIYHKYKDQLNKDVFHSLAYFSATQRDTAIALKTMVWRSSNLNDLSDMLLEMNPNGVLMGWYDDELSGVRLASSCGYATFPSDNSTNFCVYAGLKKTKFTQRPINRYEKDDQNVHYVSFTMSDGDNIMWLITTFVHDKKYYAAPNRGTIPMGWPISPALLEMSPVAAKYIYDKATPNDTFFAAFSGLGYMYPSSYPASMLDTYCKRTAEYMDGMDMKYINLVDWDGDNTDAVQEWLPTFAKYEQIQGGLLSYVQNVNIFDSINYPGAVFWENGKPFVNHRESLGSEEAKYNGAIERTAHRINNYIKDPTRIEGYTSVNVNPWTFSYDEVVDFISLLDDDVVVVTPTEMLDLIKKNVKNKTTTLHLENNDKNSFDYSNMKTWNKSSDFDFDVVDSMTPSTRTSFDFINGSQGWRIKVGNLGLDQVYWEKYGAAGRLVLKGSVFGDTSHEEPNASIFNKFVLPDKEKVTMNVYGKYEKGDVRILVADKNKDVYVVSDWTITDDTVSSTNHEYDLSKFAGQEVTVMMQYRDGSANGSVVYVESIDIK